MRNGVDIFLLTEVTTLKHLIDFLRRGKRLENPSFMPKPLSDTMAKCWEKDSKNRPTFTQLENELNIMLDGNVQDQYMRMNYMQMN